MVRLLSVLFSAFALLTMAACSSDDPDPLDDACEEGLLCDGACVDTDVDPAHCGTCNHACPEGHSCSDGLCEPPSEGECAAPLLLCGDECVDTDTDLANCGGCGAACDEGQVCEAGTCTDGCPGEQELCDGSCTELAEDPLHCGACGKQCGSDQVCVDGSCACEDGLTMCGTECVDTQSDDAHCGGCEISCGEKGFCDEGSCACDPGFEFCDGACVDTDSDSQHCGQCGTSCEDLPGVAGAICLEGACQITACEAGLGDCNEDVSDGCEKAIWDDVENCGGCGITCSDLHATATACIQDTCTPTCEDGFGVCSMNPEYGCSIDHENDPMFCGDCFTACSWYCSESTCFEALQIASGAGHSCMLLDSGEIYCWGKNNRLQLGRNDVGDESPVPVLIDLGEREEPVRFVELSIEAGAEHTCARSDQGGVWCWGQTQHGRLGDGTTASGGALPVVAIEAGATSVAAGRAHSCAVVDGDIYCWGHNTQKQAGPGTGPRITTPTKLESDEDDEIDLGELTFVQVAGGANHSCALTTEGEVLCWGGGAQGQLGTGDNPLSRELPTAAVALPEAAAGVAAGDNFTCAWTVGGAAYCWGNASDGRLGDGEELRSGGGLGGPPVPTELEPVPVVELSGVEFIATSDKYACAVTSGGTYCWGTNGSLGLLGDGRDLSTSTPVAIEGWGRARSMGPGSSHHCILDEGGAPSCWGKNDAGQLGNGSTGEDSNVPVPVLEPTP